VAVAVAAVAAHLAVAVVAAVRLAVAAGRPVRRVRLAAVVNHGLRARLVVASRRDHPVRSAAHRGPQAK